jgi:hypothetical protein
MRAVTVRRLAALFLVVPLLAACGGEDDPKESGAEDEPTSVGSSDTGTDQGSGDDACSVLTTDAVAEAVGGPVKEGVASSAEVMTGGTQTTCVWSTAGEGFATATLTVYTDRSAADSVLNEDSLPLPEVGNDAFIGSVASVWGYAGEGSFMTQWYEMGALDEESLPKSIALAKAYLDAL